MKTTEDINRITKLPVIGYIADVKREDYEGVYVARKPRSIVAEEFRALRTNISFAEVDERIKTLYITSAGVSEGKSFVSANLAEIHAQGGKKVVLLDADLRRSSVHEILGISNQKGLSDVFRGNISLDEAINYVIGEDFGVIPSGKLPPNPADLISSKKMESILEELMSKADIAIIDGPPFVVSEASVLANKVNGVGSLFAALPRLVRPPDGAPPTPASSSRTPRTRRTR